MSHQNFDICSRLAYVFSVCSTRLLEPVLDDETIYYDCSKVTEPFTLNGKGAILKHLTKLFKYIKQRKTPYFSTVVSSLYVCGVAVNRFIGDGAKDKIYIVNSQKNIIQKITVHSFKAYSNLTFHPELICMIEPTEENYEELCGLAISEYNSLKDFTFKNDLAFAAWQQAFEQLCMICEFV